MAGLRIPAMNILVTDSSPPRWSKAKREIAEAAVAAFLPDPVISNEIRNEVVKLLRSKTRSDFSYEAFRLIERSGYVPASMDRSTLRDLAGVDRLQLLGETVTSLHYGLDNLLQGLDADALEACPVQKLERIRDDSVETVDWVAHWTASGGRLFRGEMMAFKWDPVWTNVSAFALPFPPFQLGSGYWVEDVLRPEAEDYGFDVPVIKGVKVTVELDSEDLKRRFAKALASLAG